MMLKIVGSWFIIFVMLLSQSCTQPTWDCLESAKKRIYQDYPNTENPISRIAVDGNIDVILYPSRAIASVPMVTIEAGQAVINSVKVAYENNTVSIQTTNTCEWVRKSWRKPVAHVKLPALAAASMFGIGKLESADTMKLSRFDLESEGQGDIHLNFEADTLSFLVQELGNFYINGECNYLRIQNNNYSVFHGSNLKTSIAEIYAPGVGSIFLGLIDSLYAELSGAGNVYFSGAPDEKLDVTATGNGKAIRR